MPNRNRGRRNNNNRRKRRGNNQNNQPRRNFRKRPNNNPPRRQPRSQRRGRGPGPVEMVGAAIGRRMGWPRTGRLVGRAIGQIAGTGAYTMTLPAQNSLMGMGTPPAFGDMSACTRLCHREYITDIYSSTTFNNTQYPLNPGNGSLFPWLQYLAGNFEQYHIHGIVLEYKSTSSNALNSINTALGTIGLVTQYDVASGSFANKQEAENYTGAQSANPSESILHFVECAPRQNVLDRLYTRTGPVPSGQDARFYDLGNFNVFTTGMQQSGVNIGELWVSYDVEFFKAKIPDSGLAGYSLVDTYHGVLPISSIFGTLSAPSYNKLGTFISGPSTFNIPATAPAGKYVVLMFTAAVSGTWTVNPIQGALTTVNCTQELFWNKTIGSFAFASGQYSMYAFCVSKIFNVAASVSWLGFTAGTGPTALNADILVSLLPQGVTVEEGDKPIEVIIKMLEKLGYDVASLVAKNSLDMELMDFEENKAPEVTVTKFGNIKSHDIIT